MRRIIVLASIAAAALGASLLLRPALFEPRSLEVPHERSDPSPSTAAIPRTGPADRAPSAESRDPAPEPELPPVDPDRRSLAQPDGPDEARAMADSIAYPRSEKLTQRPLSTIPHHVVGAWDDAPDSPELGSRRAFILVVEPDLSDGDLANLARDVRDSHRDAEWLTLRIFDHRGAATRPSWTDGGRSQATHLVAELRRNTAGQGESLTVRGHPTDL